MPLATVEAALLDCVRERAKNAENLDACTPLLKDGVLDSLGVINLMTLTETLLGREMSDEEFELKRFQTVQTILDEFFAEAAVAS